MSEERKPDLSLPEAPPQPPKHQRGGFLNLLIVLLLIALLVLQFFPAAKPAAETNTAGGAPPTDWKELALKLRAKNLHHAAADAWRRHLAMLTDGEERGKIYYEIGKQLMKGAEYEDAIAAFYQADTLLGAGSTVSKNITESIAGCLERLGKFAEKDRELRERVHADAKQNTGQEIAAEIGLQRIPVHELDRQISREIELQLSWQLAVPPEQEKELRKQYLKRYENPKQKLQKLYQMVGQEVLYRRGRELELDKSPALQELLAQTREQLVAQAVIARELRDKINPTEADLRTYFEANKQHFTLPPRASVRILPTDTAEKATELLKKLKTEEDLLKEASASGTDTSIFVENTTPGAPLGDLGTLPALSQAVFSREQKGFCKEPVEVNGTFYIFYITSFEPGRTPDFANAGNDVINDYYQHKQQELKQTLIQELFARYGAVIHEDVVLGTEKKEEGKTDQ